MIPVSTAYDYVISAASKSRRKTARIPVFPVSPSSINLISAADVFALRPHPQCRTSIVDGYALPTSEFSKNECFKTSEHPIFAGGALPQPEGEAEGEGLDLLSDHNNDLSNDHTVSPTGPLHAIYVTTGAVMPCSHPCVVPIER